MLDIRILHLKIKKIASIVSFLDEPAANSKNDIFSLSPAPLIGLLYKALWVFHIAVILLKFNTHKEVDFHIGGTAIFRRFLAVLQQPITVVLTCDQKAAILKGVSDNLIVRKHKIPRN